MTPYFVSEAQALQARLQQVQPFALQMPMVTAARIDPAALKGIENLLYCGKRELESRLTSFQQQAQQRNGDPEVMQQQFALLKLRFNALLDQLDIFADVLAQRGEHHTGVWVAGLDALVRDGIRPIADFAQIPPLVCFLERGHGAAIRRARTRLPGGRSNPVGVIQVPRERMISNGIASSLIHEVGHQVAALMNFLQPLRQQLNVRATSNPEHSTSWLLIERWISEIMADVWAVGLLGIGATTGLMSVVSLPRYFVFRINTDDPHPFPWIRVMISAAVGQRWYPGEQWEQLKHHWHQCYPIERETSSKLKLLRQLETIVPEFVDMLSAFRPGSMHGRLLTDLFPLEEQQPGQLRREFQHWNGNQRLARERPPCLVFATLAQARFDGRLDPFREQLLLNQCLQHWAYHAATKI
ncbi:MAG TPA: hypothetical protein PK228_09135 [Saprospiraceae bacterium]|nr:hypothetical protein [Saprospiraceae bacterium]